MKFCQRVDNRKGIVKAYYDYICPNSEAYGDKFCKKKIKYIIVKDFSWLGRDYVELGNYLE